MRFECIILDFDGTFTEVEKEAGPFLAAYRVAVEQLVGSDVAEAWADKEAEVRADPGRYGWTHEGRVVAPANSDPYLRATVVTNLLLDERGILPDPVERTAILQRLYKDNYPKAGAAFRPDAKRVIEALVATGKPVHVVTNSDTRAVEAKLDALAPQGRDAITVRGDAKKFVVVEPEPSDARFDSVPAEERLDGLARPVFLRRGHYYSLLREIWTDTGAAPETTFVVGDIYELDLALPARLGVHVHLLARPTTPAHERAAVLAHGGHVSEDLAAVLTQVGI